MPARFTNAMYCDPTSVAYMPRRYMKFTLSVQFQHRILFIILYIMYLDVYIYIFFYMCVLHFVNVFFVCKISLYFSVYYASKYE